MNLSKPIKLILAEDDEFFLEGFKSVILKNNQDIILVSEARTGKELIDQVDKYQPDIVITDIKMPELSGLEATKWITSKYQSVSVIALTMHYEDEIITNMLFAGAKGYLTKNTTKKEILAAIKTVHSGKMYFTNYTSQKIISSLVKHNSITHTDNVTHFTDQEIRIIRMIGRELTTKQIASNLSLKTRTVDDYRKKIQEKTNAKNMVGIILYAIRNNLIPLEDL
jgi:DNA-binding NarL/FixJ family response regulator